MLACHLQILKFKGRKEQIPFLPYETLLKKKPVLLYQLYGICCTFMLAFEKQVLAYCIQHEMFSGETVLVALSGGGDSVALLYLLVRISDNLGLTVEAAHLNHSMRGDESDEDERFCRNLCSKLNIPLSVERLNEGEIYNGRNSVETAAREARLAFLQHIASLRNASKIATGHTLDDLTETVLQRILRGTGPSGLSGILPVREELWVRPMLCVTRKVARDYLKKLEQPFREDSTNIDTRFFRNQIRHELLPFIKESFSPNIEGVLARLAELSRIQEEYLDEKMTEAYRECIIHEDVFKILLDKSKLMGYHILLQQRMIRHCLKILEGAGRDSDMGEIENIFSIFRNERGKADITAKIACEVQGGIAAFAVKTRPFNPLPVKIPGETVIPTGGGRIICKTAPDNVKTDGKMDICINPEIIENYGDLTVGTVKPGDSIHPIGKKRAVKIRDIFSSILLPGILRNYVPIVRAGAVPVWIPGLESSDCLRLNAGDRVKNNCMIFRFKDGIQWDKKL